MIDGGGSGMLVKPGQYEYKGAHGCRYGAARPRAGEEPERKLRDLTAAWVVDAVVGEESGGWASSRRRFLRPGV